MATTFHPELTDDPRVHPALLAAAAGQRSRRSGLSLWPPGALSPGLRPPRAGSRGRGARKPRPGAAAPSTRRIPCASTSSRSSSSPRSRTKASSDLRALRGHRSERAGDTRLFYDDWGRRRLAYEIRNFQKGHYLVLHFLSTGKVVPELEHAARLDDSILRFLTVLANPEVEDIEARKARRCMLEEDRKQRAAERAVRDAEEAAARPRATPRSPVPRRRRRRRRRATTTTGPRPRPRPRRRRGGARHGQVKLILTESVHRLGEAGDLVSVKPGFARNFLLPQGKAMLATESRVKELEHHKRDRGREGRAGAEGSAGA